MATEVANSAIQYGDEDGNVFTVAAGEALPAAAKFSDEDKDALRERGALVPKDDYVADEDRENVNPSLSRIEAAQHRQATEAVEGGADPTEAMETAIATASADSTADLQDAGSGGGRTGEGNPAAEESK